MTIQNQGLNQDFLLVEGITQAADEINEKKGLFGRKINIEVFYSENDADEQRLAKTKKD